MKDTGRDVVGSGLSLVRLRKWYWRVNLIATGLLLFVWALVGFGASIFFVQPLNAFRLPGTHFPLGFWFAQQGAIVVFVGVILSYCFVMNWLDRSFFEARRQLAKQRGVEEEYER